MTRLFAVVSAVFATAVVAVLVSAAPASAHSTAGLPSTDWRSRVEGVRVGGVDVPAIEVRLSDIGQHIEVHTNGRDDVVVLGYSGEPFLWFTHGHVLENLRSPAVWLNHQANVNDRVPSAYSADAIPLWHTVASTSSYRWHDHRTHSSPGHARSYAWTVPIRVNQIDGAIRGRLDLVPGPALGLLLVTIAIAVVAVTLLAVRRPKVMSFIALAAAAAAAVQLTGTWRATTATVWQRLGPSAYATAAIAAAGTIAVRSRARDRGRYAEALLVGGVVLAITGGLSHFDWLTHSQLPTVWRATTAQALLIVQLTTGIAATIAAVFVLEPEAHRSRTRTAPPPSETPPEAQPETPALRG